jgi:hypothetical protein
LDALAVGIGDRAVNWILDADIKGFFDNISHDWMMRFVEHRIGDRRVLRLIRGWLKAGVVEDGMRQRAAKGTPQGAVISPPASAGASCCWRTSIFTTSTICGPSSGDDTSSGYSNGCAAGTLASLTSSGYSNGCAAGTLASLTSSGYSNGCAAGTLASLATRKVR